MIAVLKQALHYGTNKKKINNDKNINNRNWLLLPFAKFSYGKNISRGIFLISYEYISLEYNIYDNKTIIIRIRFIMAALNYNFFSKGKEKNLFGAMFCIIILFFFCQRNFRMILLRLKNFWNCLSVNEQHQCVSFAVFSCLLLRVNGVQVKLGSWEGVVDEWLWENDRNATTFDAFLLNLEGDSILRNNFKFRVHLAA